MLAPAAVSPCGATLDEGGLANTGRGGFQCNQRTRKKAAWRGGLVMVQGEGLWSGLVDELEVAAIRSGASLAPLAAI